MISISTVQQPPMKAVASALTPHAAITINGDAGFLVSNASTGISWGSGTAVDPFIIEGWDINASLATGIIIQNTNAYFILRDCYIHDGGGSYYGIYMNAVANATLQNNTCTLNYNGIHSLGASRTNITENNISGNANIGIYLSMPSNVSINNNTVTGEPFGIQLYSSDSDNLIADNNCSLNNYGIYIYNTYGAARTLVHNNTCISDSDYAITLDSATGNLVTGNNCSGGTIGIYVYLSNHNGIENNTCLYNMFGVEITSSSFIALNGSDCRFNSWYGIYVYSSNSMILDNNTCDSNSLIGIYVYSSNKILLSGNKCSLNTHQGIELDSTNLVSLERNNCSANNWFGIELFFSDNNRLGNNSCLGNLRAGIFISASSSNNIGNNSFSDNLVGIYFDSTSSFNSLTWNRVHNNTHYGVEIYSGSDNSIRLNIFIGNNGSTGVYNAANIQASDNSTSNSWNSAGSPHGFGNYWSDWLNPDADLNGIVDSPYVIDGSAGTEDLYPLTTAAPDIIPPSCTITSPTSGPTYSTGTSTIDLGGTASDNVGVVSVAWSNAATGGSGPAVGTTSWSVTGISLQLGDNDITVTAQDATGNTGSSMITVTYSTDTTSPSCTITSPTGSSTYSTGSPNIDLGGDASDNVGVTSVTWNNAATGGSGTASGTTSWSIAGIPLNSGSNSITVTAHDAAGNSGSALITVTYSTDSPPTVSITSPTSNPTFSTPNSLIDIGGTASDDNGVTVVSWVNDRGGSGTAMGTTSWSITSILLQPGDNNITVTAHDTSSQTGTDIIKVNYNPSGGSLSVSGSASKTSGSSPLDVSFSCNPMGGTQPYTFSWTFGDGGSSTQQNPSHTYTQDGNFTVNLMVSDSMSQFAYWNITIHVGSGNGNGGGISGDEALQVVTFVVVSMILLVLSQYFLRKKEK